MTIQICYLNIGDSVHALDLPALETLQVGAGLLFVRRIAQRASAKVGKSCHNFFTVNALAAYSRQEETPAS